MFVIGSPPCTMFSALQAMNPAVKGSDPEKVDRFRQELGKARKHLEFCCLMYEYQLDRGRHFIHEHPWGARSWDVSCIQKLLGDKRVLIAKVDQCRFGLETTNAEGELGPARKRTGFVSSSWTVIEELEGTCDGRHQEHHPLLEGRAKKAEVYPPEMCRAICRGVSRQKLLEETGQTSSRRMSKGQLSSMMNSVKWRDEVHEDDGGGDAGGARPQDGRAMLEEDMYKWEKA